MDCWQILIKELTTLKYNPDEGRRGRTEDDDAKAKRLLLQA